MGYRIHLNIIDKQVFNKYKENYKDTYFHIHYLKKEQNNRVEIMDYIELDQFKKLDVPEQEYHPCILNKNDFKILIKTYQEKLLNNAQQKIKEYKEIRDLYNETEDMEQIKVKLLHSAWLEFMLNTAIESFFKRALKRDSFTVDSDTFLLQYFHLVTLYNNFEDEKQVAIITHG